MPPEPNTLETPTELATPAKASGVVAALCMRELLRFFRQRNRVVGALGQPLLFWGLFAAGFGPSFRPADPQSAGQSYGEYFFPGTVVLILLFTAIFATISIIEDRREGFLQSVLVAPIPRWSMVLGKLLGGTFIAMLQALVFLTLGAFIGRQLWRGRDRIPVRARPGPDRTRIRDCLADGFHARVPRHHERFSVADVAAVGGFLPAGRRMAVVDCASKPDDVWCRGVASSVNMAAWRCARFCRVAGAAVLGDVLDGDARFCRDYVRPVLENGRLSHDGRFIMTTAVRIWIGILFIALGAYASISLVRYYEHAQVNAGEQSAAAGVSSKPPANQKSLEDLANATLTERSDKPFARKDLEGKVWIGSFFFASCPGTCRQINTAIAGLQLELKDKDVQLISITVDPDNDTPAVLREYAKSFGADPKRGCFSRAIST